MARVIDEIAKPSLEQEPGISQINHVVMRSEETKHHSAVLAEESASAAEYLAAAANQLILAVIKIKLSDRQGLLANLERSPRSQSPTSRTPKFQFIIRIA